MKSSLLLLLLLLAASTPPPRPHIILISVDTLRADHLGAYGYAKPTSPFLDSLAARGLLFENAYTPRPATSPSHASLLTSLLPQKHAVVSNGFVMAPNVDTLAQALRRAGYDTAGVVAVTHIGRAARFERGFDAFTDPVVRTVTDDNRRDADEIDADARRLIDAHVASRRRQPLFLFVHYFDCHYPYRWWDRTEKADDPWSQQVQKQRDVQLRRYDDGVMHVDTHIRRLYEEAVAKLGPNVVFCVTADHGEQIGDHGLPVGHADIYRETVAVPLIIAGPGIPTGRVPAAVSTMDIGVALTKLAGAKFSNPVDGQDLLAIADRSMSWLNRLFSSGEKRPLIITGNPVYTRSVALIDGSQWYIRNFDYVYRNVWVEIPAPDSNKPSTPLDASGTIPYTDYEPRLVSIEHVAADPDCAMTALATVNPEVNYIDEAVAFRRSIRMTLPVARLDRVSFTVTPARCAGKTTYRVRRFEDAANLPAPARRDTYIFGILLAARKLHTGDELFDISRDASMLNNLAGRTATDAFDKQASALFTKIAAQRQPPEKVNPEELQRLRSLGYLH